MKRCRFSFPMLLGVLLLVVCAGAAQCAILYVRTSGSDLNSGASWAQAKKTIQAAVNAAVSGDEVWVAAGSYKEKVILEHAVSVLGGFNGTESLPLQRNWITNVTTIDGDNTGGAAVVTVAAETGPTLDGFRITRGAAGGVYVGVGSAPVIRNNTIIDNSASLGAGIYCADQSNPQIYDNIIQSNRATSGRGGGIYCVNCSALIYNNTVRANVAYNGGGIYALALPPSPDAVVEDFPVIINNVISGNTGILYGGGILVKNSSHTIANNTVVANNAGLEGGGMFIERAADIAQANILLVGNNIIAFNGSGIYVSGDAEMLWILTNCVYGNLMYDYSPLLEDLPDLYPEGDFAGNISADPLFVDRDAGNYRIVEGSPCRDAGLNSMVSPGDKDMDGRPRIHPEGGIVDIGADEWDGTFTIYHVSPTGSDTNDGSEWRFAKRTLQAALNAAVPGDEIWVAAGTYNENITPKESTRLYGGFVGVEESIAERNVSANLTTIQGSGGSVVTLRTLSVLDGFTIRGGQIGVQCVSAVSTIESCTMTANATGIESSGSNLTVRNCSFISNTSHGVSYSATQGSFDSCQFSGSGHTGLYCISSSPTVSNCQFTGNVVYGVRLEAGSSPSIFNTTIRGSETGVFCHGESSPILLSNAIIQNKFYGLQCNLGSSPTVDSCWISGNQRTGAYIRGSSSPVFVNTVFGGNGADALVCENSSPTLTNCTIGRNAGRGLWAHNSSPVLTNVIVAGNRAAAGGAVDNTGGGSPVISFCCFYANGALPFRGVTSPVGKNGNVAANPKFLNPLAGLYALLEGSPCLGAGNVSAPYLPTADLRGVPRPAGSVSIGAYELYDQPVAPPRVVYARSDAPAGGDGKSWATAYVDVQRAINDAATTGGQVWVRAGNYYGRIVLKEDVEVYGGFAGTETSLSQRNHTANVTSIIASPSVAAVTGEDWAAVDGFTIRGGLYGVYCASKSPRVANCTVRQNSTGLYTSMGSSVEVAGCTFDANTYYGVYCHTGSYASISGCAMTGNAGGIYCFASSPTIENCLVQENRNYGMLFDSGASPTVRGCDIINNSTGIYCYNKSAPQISGCQIYFSTWYGLRCDAQSSPGVSNSVINRNTRLAVYCYSGSSPTLVNCTIASNGTHGVLADYSAPSIVNCTIANNGGSALYSYYSTPILTNGIVAFNAAEQGGAVRKQGAGTPSVSFTCFHSNGASPYFGMPSSPIGVNSNIEADPKFLAAGLGNYSLQAGSPCVDTGSNISGLPATDLAGNPRIVNGTVDRGSLERQ